MKRKHFSDFLLKHKIVTVLIAIFSLGAALICSAQVFPPRPGMFRRPGKVVPVTVQPVPGYRQAPVQQPLPPCPQSAPAPQVTPSAPQAAPVPQVTPSAPQAAPASRNVSKEDPKSNDDSLDAAIDNVLENSENPEELAPVLRKVKSDQIQKAVEEAIRETEEDQKNETINGTVEDSLKEVDESAIEESVNQVLEETNQIHSEDRSNVGLVNENEENEDILPNSVEQILKDAEVPAVDAADELDAEVPAVDAVDELDADEETEINSEEGVSENTEEAIEVTGNSELQPTNSDFETVKLAEMDEALAIPEDADFKTLMDLFLKMDRIRPSDLNTEDPAIAEEQVSDFLRKTFSAKLRTAEKMLELENLTEEQWETAVSLKVQVLANLSRIEPSSVESLRQFVTDIESRASQSLLWNVQAVLIQMELCQFQTEPAPEELKRSVEGMLAHMKKGIALNCLNKDFALSTVQMVILTEEKLRKEEYLPIFQAAIQILDSSEDENLKETARLLENILKQKELIGQSVNLSLTTYEGKTVKTEDYAGKTLLFYCFSFENQSDLRDLSLIYQFFKAYQTRGFEIIGIVSGEKRDEMDQLLKEIPWPMVFEKPGAEDSVLNYFAISVLPAKVLVNADGKIEKSNVDAMSLMKYLEETYGPVIPKEEEANEEAESTADDANTGAADEEAEIEEAEILEEQETEESVDAFEDSKEMEISEDLSSETDSQKASELPMKAEEVENQERNEVKKNELGKEEPELDLDSILGL